MNRSSNALRASSVRGVVVSRSTVVLGEKSSQLFLAFSAGLPFLLVFSTLSAWLKTAQVDLTTIGMLSWVGLAYTLKFFWAPVVDRVSLPFLTARL